METKNPMSALFNGVFLGKTAKKIQDFGIELVFRFPITSYSQVQKRAISNLIGYKDKSVACRRKT